MEFVKDHIYIISINHPYLQHCEQDLVTKYAKSIVVQFKGWYQTPYKRSVIFHHCVKDYIDAIMVLTHVCQNYNLDDNVSFNCLESHIYEDSFVVHKDITTIVKLACSKFKQLLVE